MGRFLCNKRKRESKSRIFLSEKDWYDHPEANCHRCNQKQQPSEDRNSVIDCLTEHDNLVHK